MQQMFEVRLRVAAMAPQIDGVRTGVGRVVGSSRPDQNYAEVVPARSRRG